MEVACADSAVDDPSHRRARLALIEGLQVQATSLLWAATEDSLKTRIQLAMLELVEEAVERDGTSRGSPAIFRSSFALL
jgi:hypothetical protein